MNEPIIYKNIEFTEKTRAYIKMQMEADQKVRADFAEILFKVDELELKYFKTIDDLENEVTSLRKHVEYLDGQLTTIKNLIIIFASERERIPITDTCSQVSQRQDTARTAGDTSGSAVS